MAFVFSVFVCRHAADYEEMDLTEIDDEAISDGFEEVRLWAIYLW